MARESIHKKLERVRPPRVHITYDVEVGDAIEVKELPLSWAFWPTSPASPTEPLPRLKDRKFVEVTPDNFDSVLESMKPHLSFSVENKLSEDPDAGQLKVELRFQEPGRLRAGAGGPAGQAAAGAAGSADEAVGPARQPAGQRQARRMLLRGRVSNTEKLEKLKTRDRAWQGRIQ